MDKNFAIGIIKFLINYFKIEPNELGLDIKQKYRPITAGSVLEVVVPNQRGLNGYCIGVLKRSLVSKTPVNTQLEPVSNIMIVDSESINVDKKYHICIEQ